MKHLYLFLLILFHSIAILGHGFAADTLVLLPDNTWQQISTICNRALKKKIAVASHDTESSFQTPAPVVRGGRSQANCYVQLSLDGSSHRAISCTPVQEFYNAVTRQWVPAYMLKIGDKLLCAHNATKTVRAITLVKEPLEIYTIQVKNTHTFFVSQHSVLTHNFLVPVMFNLGLSIPFGAAACGTVGGFFGPPTLLLGTAIGCAVGVLAKIVCSSKMPTYTVEAYDSSRFDRHMKQELQTTILNEPEVTHNQGCGDTTPQKPLVLITPADPMPVFQNPGYRPLSDEECNMFSGGCTIIPIPEQKKEDTIICGGITPGIIDASDFVMAMTIDDAQKRWQQSELMRDFQKQFNEISKMVSKDKPLSYLAYDSSKQIEKALAEGERLWQEIRKNNDDINKISINTGFSNEVIALIKEHVFYRAHIKNLGVAPFDSDYDMAKAWERLTNNSFVYADLELLRHELAESLLMGEKNMPYDEAHKIVEEFFSWVKQLEGY